MKEEGGIWFGWSGDIVEAPATKPRTQRSGNITYALLDLTQEEHDGYYAGFSNRTLWPLFHYRLDLVSFRHEWYEAYRAVNARFAEQLAKMVEPDDVIWVHDYHLVPLGRELRKRGVRCRIGFFLHIPFPPSEIFVSLPWAHELGQDLQAYDVVGFQTPTDLAQFKDFVRHEAGGTATKEGMAKVGDRVFHAGVYPIGIDVDGFIKMSQSSEAAKAIERVKSTLGRRQLLIGVDRLDYSKGILERLRAFAYLLEHYPEHHAKVTFVQISAPSRESVQEYQDLRAEVEQLTGRVNGTQGEADWVPLRYINRSHTRRTLSGFFRLSRVGIVTPLRDGMNLVAEEYVAGQDADDPGVLVLSRFAGAAPLLDGAIIVNPHDSKFTAKAIHDGLVMGLDERQDRWQRMMSAVRENDIVAWRRRFLAKLQDVTPPEEDAPAAG